MKMKKILPLLKTVIFVSVCVSMILSVQRTMIRKINEEVVFSVESQPDGSYDTILIGPSHMKFGIQPAQLFAEHGIASCNVATAYQTMPQTYHMLKEMIDRHDPELVIIDVYTLDLPETEYSNVRNHRSLDIFPISRNKMEAIADMEPENKAEYYFPILLFHNRWKELTRLDYMYRTEGANETFQLMNTVNVFEEPFIPISAAEKAPIPDGSLKYLEKIIMLCEETDTQLLLTVLPYRADVFEEEIARQKIFHTLEDYTKERNIPFLNGLHLLDEMNFDFRKDMAEYSHLNAYGAEKITDFYGNYIVQYFNLTDRSQDVNYSHWYENCEKYEKALELAKENIDRFVS